MDPEALIADVAIARGEDKNNECSLSETDLAAFLESKGYTISSLTMDWLAAAVLGMEDIRVLESYCEIYGSLTKELQHMNRLYRATLGSEELDESDYNRFNIDVQDFRRSL